MWRADCRRNVIVPISRSNVHHSASLHGPLMHFGEQASGVLCRFAEAHHCTIASRICPLPNYGHLGLQSSPHAKLAIAALGPAFCCVRYRSGAAHAICKRVRARLPSCFSTVSANTEERLGNPPAQRSAAAVGPTAEHAAATNSRRPASDPASTSAKTTSSRQPPSVATGNLETARSPGRQAASAMASRAAEAASKQRKTLAPASRRAPTAEPRQAPATQGTDKDKATNRGRSANETSMGPSQRQILDRLLLGGPLRVDEPLLRRASAQRLNFSMQVTDLEASASRAGRVSPLWDVWVQCLLAMLPRTDVRF